MTSYLEWPGKSSDPQTGICHPAVYHMLDVAAVADTLLKAADFPDPVHKALLLLAALHDLGKIGDRFRAMVEKGDAQGDRHWQVSMAWFDHFDGAMLAPRLGGDPLVRKVLYAAAAGHHGAPPDRDDLRNTHRRRMVTQAGDRAEHDAGQVIEAFADLFPGASLDGLELTIKNAEGDWRRSAKTLSRWFTGLISTADWIGSNTAWFPATEAGPALVDYVAIACDRADVALLECGLGAARPSHCRSDSLFSFDAFSPMQRAALDAELPDGPALAIIEDATGSGKTEAALMLAHRMMQAGKGDGLFFALPTMATANAMFARLTALGRMFKGQPSLALSHSRAALHGGFRALRGSQRREPDEMACADWFADGRRKALLAQAGVGTIDQALLAVLPTRYFGLRLYALSRKVLLVDEAHDYDAYMQAEMERLLTFHAQLGGSAILMTATLPTEMRARLARAFQEGASRRDLPDLPDAYPQFTMIGGTAQSSPVAPVAATVRRVAVRRLATLDEALDVIAAQSARGAACAFVRNSVDEAIAAVKALRARGVEAMLHHARFALWDRLANEDRVIATFGKAADARTRRGQVIVGTQVLEQSLDICFDVMVTDLAPMGALIQRAGRLWRHQRDRPLLGPVLGPVPGPLLHVLSPDPDDVADAHWARDLLGQGWYVYSVDLQWRTAKALFAAGQIDAPDGLRALIAAVDGAEASDVPPALSEAEGNRLGEMFAEGGLANQNLLEAKGGYGDAEQVWSDETFPTRLAPEQMTLVLARRDADGALVPYAPIGEDGDFTRAWALSEVGLARHRWGEEEVDQEAPEIAAIRKGWKTWQKATHAVCPVAEDGAITDRVHYDEGNGLVVRQEMNSVTTGT
ncbi:MAG: CRISPR-associated helicase Cas3' [Pseudomonadota bacterium]